MPPEPALEIAKDIANAKLPDFDAALQQARRMKHWRPCTKHRAACAGNSRSECVRTWAPRELWHLRARERATCVQMRHCDGTFPQRRAYLDWRWERAQTRLCLP